MARRKTDGFTVQGMVTDRIIAALESGVIPWEKPWTGGNAAWSRSTGKPYSFINQLMLPSGEYVAENQMRQSGGDFIYDENGRRPRAKEVVFWKILEKEETNDEGEQVKKTIPLLRYYKVYNVETDTTLERKYNREEISALSEADKIRGLEGVKMDYITRSGVQFDEEYGDRACYAPINHKVVVPLMRQFGNIAEYYSTVFHELAHSTGHHTLLNRISESQLAAFGSEDYSREELVAELTACAILANTGVETSASFRNNAAYIGSWIKALKEDKNAIIWAASRAEKAYKLIMSIADESEVEHE